MSCQITLHLRSGEHVQYAASQDAAEQLGAAVQAGPAKQAWTGALNIIDGPNTRRHVNLAAVDYIEITEAPSAASSS